MTVNIRFTDNALGVKDLDDEYVTDAWLIDQHVGNVLFSCGYNSNGTLGLGDRTNRSSPTQVGSLTSWNTLQYGCGYKTFLATKTDGTLWGCGYNRWGDLGNNTFNISYSSPVQVGALTNWKQVACSYGASVAIKTDGTLWTWGLNDAGQLGRSLSNVSLSYSSPVQVGTLTTWRSVTAGDSQMAAIKTDGTLWTWGSNGSGQLGVGNTVSYSSPVQVGALTTWRSVSVGTNHSLAVKTDGTLWAWGYNLNGQLGLNNRVNYNSPVQIGSLTTWKNVFAGWWHSVAIKTDGTLWSWGWDDTSGRIGNNTSVDYSSPVQVGSLTTWKTIGPSRYTTMAIKTDGTLWGWGNGFDGQIGNNSINKYSSPVQVGSLTNWKQVACGQSFTAAITYREI